MRIVVISVFLVMPLIGYGQLLWSTNEENPNKRVTLEQGIQLMMENYDLYDKYSTFMGYTHGQWLDEIDDDELKKEWVDTFAEISGNEYELYASRRRQETLYGGTVLVVVVTYIDAEHISRVTFSNDIGSEFTYSSDRHKFERWFRTFINFDTMSDEGDEGQKVLYPGTTDARALYGKSDGGGSSLEMTGWMWDATPNPKENTSESGIIVFEVIIDDRGEVASAKPISYSVSASLVRIYQAEVEKLTFSKTSSGPAPPSFKGKITFVITAK